VREKLGSLTRRARRWPPCTSRWTTACECPTLVLGGEEDPMAPIECQVDIATALPAHLVRFERFPGCGHGVLPDAPERAMAVIRDFIVH